VGSLSIGNDYSSGGVPVPSAGGGTIYGGGSASVTSQSPSSRSVTTPSVSDYSNIPRVRGDDSSSIASFSTAATKPRFNPQNYGDPGLRSPNGNGTTPKSNSPWAKIKAEPFKVSSDAARQLQQELKKRSPPKAKTVTNRRQPEQAMKTHPVAKPFGDEEQLPSDEESEDDEPAPPPKAAARRAPATGAFTKSDIKAVTADSDQDGWGGKLVPQSPKRQTNTDISRQVYGQEEAYHEIANFSNGSLSDDSEGYGGVEVDEGLHG
jgi:hypothetical protein